MHQSHSRFAHLSARLRDISPDERERIAGHAFALLVIAIIAAAKSVTGLTAHSVPFTLYAIGVAAAAARGGPAAAIVAMLASLVVAPLGAPAAADTSTRMLFAAESLGIIAVVSSMSGRVRRTRERFVSALMTIARLQARNRHGRLLDAALRHIENTAPDTALVVLNAAGMITEWRSSAERLYGYSAQQAVGMSASVLLAESAGHDMADLLRRAEAEDIARGTCVHRRRDGRPIDAEFELRPYRDIDAPGYTLTVQDLAQRKEWDAYRDAAVRAQRALQHVADEMKQQLAALELVIDPSLNPMEGPEAVRELLERLRTTIDADGAALVQDGWDSGARAVATGGLQPSEPPNSGRSDPRRLTPGRVTLVHNDRERVAQTAALRWPGDVSSLMVVPIVHRGQAWSTIEVVSQRSKRATDWEVALVRIAADRLAAVVAQDHALIGDDRGYVTAPPGRADSRRRDAAC